MVFCKTVKLQSNSLGSSTKEQTAYTCSVCKREALTNGRVIPRRQCAGPVDVATVAEESATIEELLDFSSIGLQKKGGR